MKFVSVVTLALCWAAQAAATETNEKPLVHDLAMGATPEGIQATAASVQSFQLRATAKADALKNQLVDAQIKGDKSEIVQAASSVLKDTAELLAEAKFNAENVLGDLQTPSLEIDRSTDGWGEQMTTSYQTTISQIDTALDLFPKILGHLEKSAEELAPAGAGHRNLLDNDSFSLQQRVIRENATFPLPEEAETTSDDTPKKRAFSSSSSCGWDEDTARHHRRETAKARRDLKSKYQDNAHATRHLNHMEKLHRSAVNGDHAGIQGHVGSIHSRLSRGNHYGNNGRRLQSANQNKAKQCKMLMECVGQMSIYDMILYYYSDDIDPNSGDIDDNIYRHVEAPDVYEVYQDAHVVKARNQVGQNRPLSWYDSNGQRIWCDRTLQLFFRNVEYGAVPHWEGATVSKVCLAQGSHTYVKLDQIATKVGFKAADEIAEEMFACSKDLYNSNANPRKSPFPFTSQKVNIDKAGSSIVESNGSYGGVTGRMTATADSKYKMFDNNLSSYWKSRDGTKGYPTKLKIRANTARCVWWDSGDSNDYLRARDCSDSDNRFFWFYDKNYKQIKSRSDQGKCMEAKSNGGNDKVSAETCTSSRDRQRWVKDADYGAKNEGRNKCLSRGDGQNMYVKGCGGSHEQDLLEIGYNDFFTKMIPPTVEFKTKLTSNAEIKGIEINWKKDHACPRDKITIKAGLSGGSNIAFEWADDVESGDVLTQTALPTSTTSNGFRILCNNPLKRIAVYELVVFGSPRSSGSTLPKFNGNYEQSFFVPSGVEMGSSARDQYGQVKGSSVTLFKYEMGGVSHALTALQDTMEGTMKKIWHGWLKSGSDNLRLQLRTRYSNPDRLSKHDNADSYVQMVVEADDDDDIKKQMVIGFAKEMDRSYSGDNYDDREEEFDEFNDSIQEKYGSVQDGFNLVFGKDASAGYVCGIKGAVLSAGSSKAQQEAKFPGTCCLDAPYQNPGDEWGREFDCTMTCTTKAPFFSGLSEESCSAVGGTWCPSPTNCQVLKDCIDSEITAAESAGKTAYVAYLEPGVVEDHQDFDECGDSREYFGFDASYKNDADICENIKQLHNSKDFAFLDEVYAQGTPLASGPKLDWDELKEVDTSSSQSNMVQDGPVKFGLMYGLGIIRDVVGGYVDGISEFSCPANELINAGCNAVSNIAFRILHVIKLLLDLAYNAWEYTHAVTDNTNNIQPYEDWEILQIQHKNNEIMHDGTKKVYELSATLQHSLLGAGTRQDSGKIGEILNCAKDLDACRARRALMGASLSSAHFAGCDGQDQDGDGVIDNCEEDSFPPEVSIRGSMEVQTDGETKVVVGKVFQSTEEAVSSLRGALSVVDDCAGKKDLSLNLTVKESNHCQTHISATPIHHCGGEASAGQSEDFLVAVDSNPPVVSCGFRSSAGSNHHNILVVEEGQGFFDAGLSLQVEESCSDQVDVRVSVMSNEFDTNGPSAHLLTKRDGKVEVPRLFLDQSTCSSGTTDKPGFCQKSPVGSRVYKVSVEATDAAGWSATNTCHVIVTAPKKEASGVAKGRVLLHQDSTPEEKAEFVETSGTQQRLDTMEYKHHV